jgi:hypothetical protein
MPLPDNLRPGDPRRLAHGLFTYTLAEAMNTQPGATYRQLSQFILSRYTASNLFAMPTPIFSGSLLDATVFGNVARPPVRQWPVERSPNPQISAGLLAQVSDGAILAIEPDALARNDAALGFAEITGANAFSSTLRAVETSWGLAPIDWSKVPPGAYARLIRPAVDFTLRVALPTYDSPTTSPDRRTSPTERQAVEDALASLRAHPPETVRVDWLPPGAAADVRLHVRGSEIWQLASTGLLVTSGASRTPSIRLTEANYPRSASTLSAILTENLSRIGRALNLLRLGDQLSRGAIALGVTIELFHQPAKRGISPADLAAASTARVFGGDSIGFKITNQTQGNVDVTMLYVDSQFGIHPLFPRAGEQNRIDAGGTIASGGSLAPIGINDDTQGMEHLIVIATTATPQAERRDYSELAQPGVPTQRGQGGRRFASDLLDQAAFGTALTTRGAQRPYTSETFVRTYTWEVGAAPGAPVRNPDVRALP